MYQNLRSHWINQRPVIKIKKLFWNLSHIGVINWSTKMSLAQQWFKSLLSNIK